MAGPRRSGELPGDAEKAAPASAYPVGVQGILGGLEQGGRSHAAVGELAGELVERRGALGGLAEARQRPELLVQDELADTPAPFPCPPASTSSKIATAAWSS